MDTTIGSLCSGILGLDLAVEAHYGARIAWHSEIEPSVAPVIARHTDSPNLGDLTTIDWRNVEPVDILTAGYPCQPFSLAGPRKGITDDRHLWPYIADAVRVLRPRRVVLENVPTHLSLGFDAVLGDLAAAGFDAEWCVLRASGVGAPHRRARLFVVASGAVAADPDRAPAGRGGRTIPGEEGGGGDQPERDRPGDGGWPASRWGPFGPAVSRWERILGRPAPRPTDDVGRLSPTFVEWMQGFPAGWVDGLSRTAALKALGNAVVTQQAAAALTILDPCGAVASFP